MRDLAIAMTPIMVVIVAMTEDTMIITAGTIIDVMETIQGTEDPGPGHQLTNKEAIKPASIMDIL